MKKPEKNKEELIEALLEHDFEIFSDGDAWENWKWLRKYLGPDYSEKSLEWLQERYESTREEDGEDDGDET